MIPRRGDWRLSYKGNKIYPLDLRPEDIDIEEIAHSLSNLCRFGGHCKEFYSVAQHSVIVCGLIRDWIDWASADDSTRNTTADRNLMLTALLHDAPEAYCGDMVRPLKQNIPEFKTIESQIWTVIAAKFNLPFSLPKEIEIEDARALLMEKRDLLTSHGHTWTFPQCQFPDLNIPTWNIVPVSPSYAKESFLALFESLTED